MLPSLPVEGHAMNRDKLSWRLIQRDLETQPVKLDRLLRKLGAGLPMWAADVP